MAALSGVAAYIYQPRSPAESFRVQLCPKTRVPKSERRLSLSVRCNYMDGSVKSEKESFVESNVSPLRLLKTSPGNRYTKEKSSIIVIGLNYHTAPLEIREKLSIPEARLGEAINELCSLNHIEEAAVLSTCNRMEIYVVALSQRRGVKEVTEWMSKASGVPFFEICQHRFLLYNKEATNHLFEVSSGLDSIVLGEGQILSQVKQVVKSAEGVAGFGRKISGLFKHAITVGKRVRTETSLSTGSVSVSSAAVEFSLTKLKETSYTNLKVLVAGAGKMGKLVIKHLVSKGCKNMVVVNRTEATVDSIRKEISGAEITYKPLSELLNCAAEAEVIFACTASESPLLFKEQVAKFPSLKNKFEEGVNRLFIDISVPRNVEPCVSELENVSIYNVDDLKEVVEANKENRLRKLNEAQGIIIEEVGKFENWKDTLETVPTIKKLRAYGERIRAAEVEKCLSKMGENLTKKQKEAVIDLSMGIMNQLMHGPTRHLRCDASENRCKSEIVENMHTLNRVFGLDTEMSVFEEKIRAKMGQMNI